MSSWPLLPSLKGSNLVFNVLNFNDHAPEHVQLGISQTPSKYRLFPSLVKTVYLQKFVLKDESIFSRPLEKIFWNIKNVTKN